VVAGRENPEPKMLSGKNELLAQAETESRRQIENRLRRRMKNG
jgi:hypothetical protein